MPGCGGSPLTPDLDNVFAPLILDQALAAGQTLLCEHCHDVFAELDMIFHIHFGHQYHESASCPCHECKAALLKRAGGAVDDGAQSQRSGSASTISAQDVLRGDTTAANQHPEPQAETLPTSGRPEIVAAFTQDGSTAQTMNTPSNAVFGGRSQMSISTPAPFAHSFGQPPLTPPDWTPPPSSLYFSTTAHNSLAPPSTGLPRPKAPMHTRYLKTLALPKPATIPCRDGVKL